MQPNSEGLSRVSILGDMSRPETPLIPPSEVPFSKLYVPDSPRIQSEIESETGKVISLRAPQTASDVTDRLGGQSDKDADDSQDKEIRELRKLLAEQEATLEDAKAQDIHQTKEISRLHEQIKQQGEALKEAKEVSVKMEKEMAVVVAHNLRLKDALQAMRQILEGALEKPA